MSQPRVLVIDDEKLLGQTLRLGLGDVLDVHLETSGDAGLKRLLDGEAFDAILCDLRLPDRSGMEIYDAVVVSRPELMSRFVVMTGGAVTEESRLFLQRYEGALLTKPFTLSQVQALVDEMLEE